MKTIDHLKRNHAILRLLAVGSPQAAKLMIGLKRLRWR
ncbi:hypothetical protein PLANPX_2093 [Lacipirellula parvula]|uniref:Uncharacterized protein n=1 Tax=Lacipirellula parvula TaxID=2650471 RepID=A0A5K7XCA1_9BACT|nr:hypothetical protein PLANPX_2093 [Lacipirellula parvula]